MFERIFVLAPHTDDGEIGCGGAIAKFVEMGKEVFYIAFSTAQTSVRPEFPDNILEIEVKEATEVLGIDRERLIIKEFPVRNFPKHRQEILQCLIDLKEEYNPDLILQPSPNDIHQDHEVIANEGLRAFKRHTILGYEEPWNNVTFNTRSFIPLDEKHIEKKVDALECYESQKHRSYLDADFLWSLARTRGTQIEGQYAESFEVIRWIINDASLE